MVPGDYTRTQHEINIQVGIIYVIIIH